MPPTYPNYGPQLPESYYADQSLGQMDPSRQSEFPTLQDSSQWGGGILPPLKAQTSPQQGPFGADLPRDLQSMIAPYRDMASKFSSPYLMMDQNNWLARNHPRIAGGVDNALAAMALTKYPEGPASAAQNLSAAMGGMFEARQMKRQQAMQAAMLPYHMMMPQIEAEEKMAQTQNYLSEIPYRQRMGERAEAQAAAQQRYFMPHPTGQTQEDTEGNRWQEITDPVSQTSRWKNPTTNKFADEYPSEQQPKFVPQHQAGGGTEMERIWGQQDAQRMISGLPPLTPEEKKADLIRQASGRAGATTAAGEAVKTPIEDQAKFRDEQVRQRTADIPSVPSRKEYEQERNAGMSNEDLAYQYPDSKLAQDRRPNETASDYRERKYQESITPMQQEKERQQQEISQYQASPAWKHGVSFKDWKQNPNDWKTAPTSKAKPTTREYHYDAQGNRVQGPQ